VKKSTHKNLDLSIVIPVYNEPENIQKAIKEIQKNVKSYYEIIVVYDSDSDTTIPVLQKLSKEFPTIAGIKNTISKGPSGAIRTGIDTAKAPRILVTMADLCDDTTQIDKMVGMLPKSADILCPSRYSKGGRQELNAPLKVGFPKTAGFLIRLFTGMPTSDPTNSYKLYSADLFKHITLKSTISFSVTLEIMVKAHCLGYRIREIPTVWKDRQHGKTNFKLWRSIVAYTPWFVFALLRNRLFTFPHFVIEYFNR
jgi:glycosyltransferase involved in cell wall biosynthesis